MKYADWRAQKLSPPWLQGPYGKRWGEALGTMSDRQVNAAQQAVGCQFPRTAPVDALPYLGDNRNIERYPADSDASYRARLSAAWATWSTAGTRACLIGQLEAFGFVSPAIYDARGPGPVGVTPWPPDSNAANWSRFWVVLSEPFPAWLGWRVRYWDDGGTYGQLGPDGTPYTWGSTATVGQISSIRRLLRKWKPVHTVCAGIWAQFTSAGVTLEWAGS